MNNFDRDNYKYWKWGIFYSNPNDPSIWLPKRTGLGWTLNFAHPVSYLILALLVVVPLFIGLSSAGFLKFNNNMLYNSP